MTEHLKHILLGQMEASLAMLRECIEKCPAAHWDEKIAKYAFCQVAYHTLCFADLYLTESESLFVFRDLHPKGWEELNGEYPSRRFSQEELLGYANICRDKARANLAAETAETLQGPSGFARHPISRVELHLYNIRHIQHHAGQLSASLRRIQVGTRWVKTGWP
ncbi:MAG: DinB family protein [Planctomycetes bacterium]|nr:DinB family protein [Planctomycetota bacterium]